MRGAPQVGFSATMRKIKSLASFETLFLPTCFLTLEMKLQYKRNPARCQTNHGFRGHNKERLFPPRPTPASEHPEQFVEYAELGLGMLALQHGELLPECQILQEQASTRTKDANK